MAIESLVEFLDELRAFSPPSGGLRTFRGVRNYAWDILPGILRSQHANLLTSERDAVREMLSVRPGDFEPDSSMFDRLVRMQHFGLPTRLLDVTANPLVALYFATEEVDPRLEAPTNGAVQVWKVPRERKKYFDSDTVSCIANLANLSASEKDVLQKATPVNPAGFHALDEVDRLLQFIRTEKPHFRPLIKRGELDKGWYVVPKLNNARIIAQSGAFIIFGLMPLNVSGPVFMDMNGIAIDQTKKSKIRKELSDIGVNMRTLFPEIDKAASYVIDQFA